MGELQRPDRRIGVGLLGCGTVGSAVMRALTRDPRLANRLDVRAVAVRDVARPRDVRIPDGLLTSDVSAVVEDPTVDVVVEVVGGLGVAADAVERALWLGKPVVTANKDLVAERGLALADLARATGAVLRHEAAVAGGIPLLSTLDNLLLHDGIDRVDGILNGTANHVLTRMEDAGLTLDEAVEEAVAQGLAEADPARDLDGRDAAAKLAILSQRIWGTGMRESDVIRLGLAGLTSDDVAAARAAGRRYRLVAKATEACASVELRQVKADDPLHGVTGADNAVVLHTRRTGRLVLTGPGAGGDATASSVVADLLAVADGVAVADRPRGAAMV